MKCKRCGGRTWGIEQWCPHGCGEQYDWQDDRPYVGQASALPSLPRVLEGETGTFEDVIPHAKQVFLMLNLAQRFERGEAMTTEQVAERYRVSQRTAQRWLALIGKVLPLAASDGWTWRKAGGA